MEQPEVRVREHNIMLIRSLDTFGIHHASTGRSKVLHPAPERTVDIIWEGEERVARACDAAQLLGMVPLFLLRERLRYALEQTLPLLLLSTLENFTTNKKIDGVSLLSALDALLEWQCEHAGMVTEPPKVGLVACETGAVDTGLLTCADTDDGAAIGVGHTVGLSILECKGGDYEIGQSLVRQLWYD